MRSFSQIEAMAGARKGGAEGLAELLASHQPKSPGELRRIGDDRWLAMFTRCIFQAGFNWKVIEAKWDGFEAAFHGFDPAFLAFQPDEFYDRADVGHAASCATAARSAPFRRTRSSFAILRRSTGSAAAFFADYPVTDQTGLMELLKKRGSRLGGNTGQYALRFMGKESFILSKDVVNALIREGVIENDSLSKTKSGRDSGRF